MNVAAAPTYTALHDPDRDMPFALTENRKAQGGKDRTLFAEGDDNPSFWDLVDVINPLQHIPVINTLYREATGDKIGSGAQVAGDTLFGGPIGLVASLANMAIEDATGDDLGGHVMALFRDKPQTDNSNTMLAQAQSKTQTPPAPAPAVAAEFPTLAAAASPTASSGQPMIFTMDGLAPAGQNSAAPAQLAALPPVDVANASRNAPAPAQQVAAQANETASTRSLGGRPQRFMPAPARTSIVDGDKAPPPISVPVSNSGTRSNVPITGRDPVSARRSGDMLAAQKAQSEQGLANNSHPMLPSNVQQNTQNGPDWFTQAWGQALDKYQKTQQLAEKPSSGVTQNSLQ